MHNREKGGLLNKKKKLQQRMKIAELKQKCSRRMWLRFTMLDWRISTWVHDQSCLSTTDCYIASTSLNMIKATCQLPTAIPGTKFSQFGDRRSRELSLNSNYEYHEQVKEQLDVSIKRHNEL